MTFREVVLKELGDLLGLLAHPARLRIVEELGDGERDVNALRASLGISHSGVSQHLSLLRARGVVHDRREGRHVYYRLHEPALAPWLVHGLDFILPASNARKLAVAVRRARTLWGAGAARPRRAASPGASKVRS